MVTRLMLTLLTVLGVAQTAGASGQGRLIRSHSYGASQVYRGAWSSDTTGHTGPMRARITPRGDGTYDARFSGRFMLIIPFTYRVQLTTSGWQVGGPVLSAHKQLGPVLGSYDMAAYLTTQSLSGSFQAAGDNGSIMMRRVR